MSQQLQKAKVIVLGDNGEESSSIEVLFNPKEYNLKYETSYKEYEIAGTDTVITQFLHGNPAILEVSLFFDEGPKLTIQGQEEAKDVSVTTSKFIKLVYVDASLHRPPHIKFQWGSLNFTGIVTSVGTHYTMFEKDGMPTRANVDLVIKELIDINATNRKTPFESPDRTKSKMIMAGKSLWNIAYEEYGDMGQWRTIASENGITNPLDLMPGKMIKVPAL